MAISFGSASALVSLLWETTDTKSGGAATVLGFEGATNTGAGCEALAQATIDSFDDNLKAEVDNAWQLGTVRVETLGFSVETAADITGTRNENDPPSQVTILWSKSASGKGPRNRGRNYWPAMIQEADVSQRGLINGTRAGELTTAIGTFIADIAATGVELALPQSDVPGQASSPIVPWPIVVSASVSSFVATQRRRVR